MKGKLNTDEELLLPYFNQWPECQQQPVSEAQLTEENQRDHVRGTLDQVGQRQVTWFHPGRFTNSTHWELLLKARPPGLSGASEGNDLDTSGMA